MKTIIFLAISLMMIGCAKHKETVEIDSTFQPYVDRFVDAAKTQGHPVEITDLKIAWGSTASMGSKAEGQVKAEAVCHIESGETPTITVSNDLTADFVWSEATDSFREALIYHELGHCVLNRSHDTTTWASNDSSMPTIANSIMVPGLPNLDFYAQPAVHSHYIQELFGN